MIGMVLIFALWKKCCTKPLDLPAFPIPLAPTSQNSAAAPTQPTSLGKQPASLNFKNQQCLNRLLLSILKEGEALKKLKDFFISFFIFILIFVL